MVRVVRGKEYEVREWAPDEFGLGTVPLSAITADGPAASAAVIRRVLADEDIPARRIVLANAAAALWAAEAVPTLRVGVDKAAAALAAGTPRALLEQLTRPN
jgi:anthranilate phosphoribosyltransferase